MNTLKYYGLVTPVKSASSSTTTKQTTPNPANQVLASLMQYLLNWMQSVVLPCTFFVFIFTLIYTVMLTADDAQAYTISAQWQNTTDSEKSIEVGYDQDFPVMLSRYRVYKNR